MPERQKESSPEALSGERFSGVLESNSCASSAYELLCPWDMRDGRSSLKMLNKMGPRRDPWGTNGSGGGKEYRLSPPAACHSGSSWIGRFQNIEVLIFGAALVFFHYLVHLMPIGITLSKIDQYLDVLHRFWSFRVNMGGQDFKMWK